MASNSALCVLLLLCAVVACHGHQCNIYEQWNPDVFSQCGLLIDSIESALLADRSNLFVLHEAFTSSQYDPPTVFYVNYTIINCSSCLGFEIDTDSTFLGWTSSSVYAVIDPIKIITMLTGIPATLQLSSSQSSLRVLSLGLDITEIDTNGLTKEEFHWAMETITSRLEAYAYRQKDNSEHRGYVWNTDSDSAVCLAQFFLVVCAVFPIFKLNLYFIKKLQDRVSVHLSPAVFWGLFVILFFYNLIDTLLDLFITALLFVNPTFSEERIYAFYKTVNLALVLVFGFVGLIAGCQMAPILASSPSWACPFCCLCCCSRRGKAQFLYGCGFFTLVFFCFRIVANIAPILILLLVHPVIVLTDIALLSTFIFSLVVWATLAFTTKTIKMMTNSTDISSRHIRFLNWICHLIALSIFIIAVFFLDVTYRKILWRSTESDDYFKSAISFLPSAVLAVTGFVIKRNFLDKQKQTRLDNQEADDQEKTDQTKVSLEDLEEGRGANDTPEVVVELHDKENTRTEEGLGVNCDTQPLIDSDETTL